MECTISPHTRVPCNKGKLVGQKAPFKPKEVWAIRTRLQMENRARELALFDLGIDSKLRACDLVKLRVRDVCHGDRVAGRATILQQKTQRPVQPASKRNRLLLDRARALQTRIASLYVFCDRGGVPLKKKTLWRRWVRACKAAGVVDAHFHDLRAAGATEMDRRGGDAQKFLGHRTRQTTEVYLRDRRLNVVTPLKRKM
jgi:integrase